MCKFPLFFFHYFKVLFDVGGIIGAIAAGVISDYSGMPATTCTGMLAMAVPMVS